MQRCTSLTLVKKGRIFIPVRKGGNKEQKPTALLSDMLIFMGKEVRMRKEYDFSKAKKSPMQAS
jgi:hypothetical protein